MVDQLKVERLSPWAVFCIEVCGLRFFDKNKTVNRHRLFNIVSAKFDLNSYDLKRDSGKITNYLASRFEVKEIDLR